MNRQGESMAGAARSVSSGGVIGVACLALLFVALGACSIESPPTEPPKTPPAAVGTITFGSAENPETSFGLSEEVAWRASLPAPITGTKVNIVITKRGGRTELFGYEQFITYPGATVLVNRMPLGRFLRDPGLYVMRYVTTDGEVVAEGEFELVPSD